MYGVNSIEKQSTHSLDCFSIAFPPFGWQTSSQDSLIAYLSRSDDIMIIFRCKQIIVA